MSVYSLAVIVRFISLLSSSIWGKRCLGKKKRRESIWDYFQTEMLGSLRGPSKCACCDLLYHYTSLADEIVCLTTFFWSPSTTVKKVMPNAFLKICSE